MNKASELAEQFMHINKTGDSFEEVLESMGENESLELAYKIKVYFSSNNSEKELKEEILNTFKTAVQMYTQEKTAHIPNNTNDLIEKTVKLKGQKVINELNDIINKPNNSNQEKTGDSAFGLSQSITHNSPSNMYGKVEQKIIGEINHPENELSKKVHTTVKPINTVLLPKNPSRYSVVSKQQEKNNVPSNTAVKTKETINKKRVSQLVETSKLPNQSPSSVVAPLEQNKNRMMPSKSVSIINGLTKEQQIERTLSPSMRKIMGVANNKAEAINSSKITTKDASTLTR